MWTVLNLKLLIKFTYDDFILVNFLSPVFFQIPYAEGTGGVPS